MGWFGQDLSLHFPREGLNVQYEVKARCGYYSVTSQCFQEHESKLKIHHLNQHLHTKMNAIQWIHSAIGLAHRLD